MKAITKILVVILVLLGALIAYTLTDRGEAPTPTTAVPVESAEEGVPDDADDELHMAARLACREFLLQTLDRPDDAELDNYEVWTVGQRPEGTLEVTIIGRIMDGLGEMIDARWNCIVFPDAQQMRLVSLAMMDASTEDEILDDVGVEATDLAPRPNLETLEETQLPSEEVDVDTFVPGAEDDGGEEFDPAEEAEEQPVFQ